MNVVEPESTVSSREWISWFVHFEGDIYGEKADRIVVEILAPACDGGAEVRDWFLVRYGEGGAHLRLRIATSPNMREEVRREVCENIRVRAFTAGMRLDIRPGQYVREITRYGGEASMPLCEECFVTSTRFACQGLADTTKVQTRSKRRLLALVSGVGIYRALDFTAEEVAMQLSRIREISEMSSANLSPVTLNAIASLWTGDSTELDLPEFVHTLGRAHAAISPRILAAIVRGTSSSSETPQMRWRLASSLVHMNNNRIGISPREERINNAYLARTRYL